MLVSPSWFCRVESWVVDRKFVGHGCWVRGSPIYTNLWVAATGFVGHQFTRIRGSRLLGSWVTNAWFVGHQFTQIRGSRLLGSAREMREMRGKDER